MLNQLVQIFRASGASKLIVAMITMFVMLLPLRFNDWDNKKK